MRPPARVTSLDLIRDFRTALAVFKADGQDALTANALDIRRAFDWLNDQRQMWLRTVRECQDELTRAKADLARKQTLHPGDRQPDCTQEIKALRRAQAQLEYAENKVEKCRRWEPAIRRAADEYEGPARQLSGLLEGGVPKALSLLERLAIALEEYVAVAPRAVSSPPLPGWERGSGSEGEFPSPPAPLPQGERGENSTDASEP